MKKFLYKIINRLGYRIENKSTAREQLIKALLKYSHLQNFNIIVLAKNYVLNLEERFTDFSIENHKSGFLVSFDGLKIYIESLEEFHILNEVFIKQDYGYKTTDKVILIDIGTNIGITSLFFSGFDYIDKIYGFEPVEETYNQANYNLELNKDIHKVESIKNIGLAKNDRKEIFSFDNTIKGNTGVRGALSPNYSKSKSANAVEVTLKDASDELSKIIDASDNKKIIVKMDCEGAEYEILENLKASKVLNKIDLILLEWHDEGYELIEQILLESRFNFITQNINTISGMVYAYKC